TGETVRFRLGFRVAEREADVGLSLTIRSAVSGEIVANIHQTLFKEPLPIGTTKSVDIHLPEFPILPGEYRLQVTLSGEGGTKNHDDVAEAPVGLPGFHIPQAEEDSVRQEG